MTFLFIALGGFFGGLTRYLCMKWISERMGDNFPWGTLFVNGLGSFLLGAILGADAMPEALPSGPSWSHALFSIGFCGGYTTFSTFSLQTISLISAGKIYRALANILGSVALCLLCVACGFAVMERLLG